MQGVRRGASVAANDQLVAVFQNVRELFGDLRHGAHQLGVIDILFLDSNTVLKSLNNQFL